MLQQEAVVVVTGAASGIGKATATQLSGAGCSVVGVDFDPGLLEKKEEYGYVEALIADVSDPSAMTEVFSHVASTYGRLDGVAHVAGVSGSDDVRQRVAQVLGDIASGKQEPGCDFTAVMSDEEWDRVIRINLNGTFYVVRAALNVMIPRRAGAIVTISSLSADTPYAGTSHYAAAKGGLRQFTMTVAKEVIGYGIRLNCVSPGGVQTPMWQQSPMSKVVTMPPIGRYATPNEIADAIIFLLSDESSYIVGHTLRVNGGALML